MRGLRFGCSLIGAVSHCLHERVMSCSPHVLEYLMPVNYVLGRYMIAECGDDDDDDDDDDSDEDDDVPACEEAMNYYLLGEDSCYQRFFHVLVEELTQVQPNFTYLCE